jgi:pimeloyl-ACP methyl ester carboxylesterase
MAEKKFNLINWFTEKIEEEKSSLNMIAGKLKQITDEIKLQLSELKDDSHYLVPIINGLHGDSMHEKGHPALIKMSFRNQSRDIGIDEVTKLNDLSGNCGRLIIFVHGLMNDEAIWKSNPEDILQRLGSFLEKQNNANILYLRYNTGRHISENGREFSLLLEKLCIGAHTKINELYIVAHSMGGLVTRSACHYANVLNHEWLKLLKKVFLIGVPNDGSYLARVAHMTQYFLRKADPTENHSIAKVLEIRSNGIKDLSFGFLVDEDWQNTNYENQKKTKATKIFPVPNVEYHLIAATVSDKNEKKKLFTFFGDGLVEKQSALSDLFKDNKIQTGLIHFKLFEGENHLSLLESNAVQEYMIENLEF